MLLLICERLIINIKGTFALRLGKTKLLNYTNIEHKYHWLRQQLHKWVINGKNPNIYGTEVIISYQK